MAAAAAQCLLIRELFAVSRGNELITGIVLGIWLLSAAAGSRTGYTGIRVSPLQSIIALYTLSFTGIITIRLSVSILKPGESYHPLMILTLILVSTIPCAFFSGFTFGRLSSDNPKNTRLYGFENMGNMIGMLCIVLLSCANSANTIMLFSVFLISGFIIKNKVIWIISLSLGVFILSGLDMQSVKLKYPDKIERISYIPEGEAGFIPQNGDTTILINRNLYKSGVSLASVEQTVHIPLAFTGKGPKDILLVFDRGEGKELKKYPDLNTDIIENKKFMVQNNDIYTTPESYSTKKSYDCILLSVPMPENISSARFFTKGFFKKLKKNLKPGGIISFTLPFSENYASEPELKMFLIIKNTLGSVFENISVFPGRGYTFLASEKNPIDLKKLYYSDIRVDTELLSPYVIPETTSGKIESVNNHHETMPLNTVFRPLIISPVLEKWLQNYKIRIKWAFAVVIVICIVSGFLFFFRQKSRESVSIFTTGIGSGAYSICLMILFQARYGSLYLNISILLLSLYSGFTLGSLVKKMKSGDFIIGLFLPLSAAALIIIPPEFKYLFYVFHGLSGFLAGAQFCSCKNTGQGILNTADLAGGVIGMTLVPIVVIPEYGIIPVIAGITLLKTGAGIICSSQVSE